MNQGFHKAAITLLREAFEGVAEGNGYTWFVQGKEGILDALTTIDAAQASFKPGGQAASIAGHAYHMLYLLRGANMCQGHPAPEGTWESSWEKQSVTPEEWATLGTRIREVYKSYLHWFAANTDWTYPDAELNTLAPLPHVAYHLGAMRQAIAQLR